MDLQQKIPAFISREFARCRIIKPEPDGTYNKLKLETARAMGRTVTLDEMTDAISREFGVKCNVSADATGNINVRIETSESLH